MNAAPSDLIIKERKGWTMDDVPWDRFDASKVDPEMVKIIKAAAMVEYNAHDYASHVGTIFTDDQIFQAELEQWAKEETQHGAVLGRWAEMADPTFQFKKAFKAFVDGYKISTVANTSVRGSRSGELVARCIVETGTSNYYTALAEATEEPVLKFICRQIAGDEHRHYKLFLQTLDRYLAEDGLNRLDRLKIGISRIAESEDDELAYAYYAANEAGRAANDNSSVKVPSYNRLRYQGAYAARAFACYRSRHVDKMVNMLFKACGLNTQGWLAKTASKLAWYGLQAKRKAAERIEQSVA